VNAAGGTHERLAFLADVVTREAHYLSQTDARLFSKPFGLAEVGSLPGNPDLSERVDAFVARFGRLQDTLAGGACCPGCRTCCSNPSARYATT
jgi:hypothetical protein